jgi:hypothetical protein
MCFHHVCPRPRNITEVGGYLNLLETLIETEMRSQVLASILGVAGPNPMPGFEPTGPAHYDVLKSNDRPAGANQAFDYPFSCVFEMTSQAHSMLL